jgi:hypothetical protein
MLKQPIYKPEIFTSGFIDIMNTGQVNASARFIRLFIGEPDKFALSVFFYAYNIIFVLDWLKG